MTIPSNSIQSFLTSDVAPGLRIAGRGERVVIHTDPHESLAVHAAVANLASDLASVCGAEVEVSPADSGARIIVGTLGVSPSVDAAVASGDLDLSPLHDDDGRVRWEGHLACVIDGVLHLVGADRRGTVYAVYDFTRAIGVSPWRWWADVPVRSRKHVTVAPDLAVAGWPSVKYRGVFLNDEEELDNWARAHTADQTIGPETYARVCELILRLKGNYLWPAMHVGAFNHDPENARIANDLGIIIGTSHCDMLLRSNEHEFEPWLAEQNEPVAYDYSIPGRNRELLQEYWRGSILQNRDYEVTWNVGMRGIHDTGFQTTAIDSDDTLRPSEKHGAKVTLLGEVIKDQRELLADALGESARTAPQLFIPYKEVLPLYDAGLDVPDDITIVWANDNFGHIRRLPGPDELKRSGGHGLYYHCSYWSNLTTSYLATSSTPLPLMRTELRRAWDSGIRELWVNNIGGLKPLEHEMEFFLTYAWEAGRESKTADIDEFTAEWIDGQFSGGHGSTVARLHADYTHLNQQRKIEHLTADAFPQVGHGDEAGRRLASLRDIYDRTNSVLTVLPEPEQDAFMQLVGVKIHMAYLTNGQFVHADRSRLAHEQGKFAAADEHLEISRAFEANKRALIHFYNHEMSGGKWSGMFTPEAFPPPVMPLHPAGTPALQIREPGLGVVVWGERAPTRPPRLRFDPHGTPSKWIEIFTTGASGLPYKLDADPWIRLSRHSGTVHSEVRITVEVPDPARAAGRTGTIRITSPTTGEITVVGVEVLEAQDPPGTFVGSLEGDGHVTIDPSHPDQGGEGWRRAPQLGRYGNAALRAEPTDAGAADAEFGFHLRTPGAHLLELHRLPTLDATGRIRVGVSVDNDSVAVIESQTTDEHRGVWAQAVQDNVEVLRQWLPWLPSGPHVLKLRAIDPHVTLSKLVIHTGEPVDSNLGPLFSTHTHRHGVAVTDPDPTALDLDALADDALRLYRIHPSQVPPPEQVFAGRGFWVGDTTFRAGLSLPQPPARARFAVRADGSKDIVREIGQGIVVEEAGVIAFEAENSLVEDANAWTTPASGDPFLRWTHTQAETDGRTGLAMHVLPRGRSWPDPENAPGLHYRLRVATPGSYRVWLLLKYDDRDDDACTIALDGQVQMPSEQFCGGELGTYGTRQVWLWALLSELPISPGDHTFSVLAAKSGLRLDRVYLTCGEELPPLDADWAPSRREPHPVPWGQGRDPSALVSLVREH